MHRTAAEGLRSNHGRQDRSYAQLAIHVIKEMYPEEDDRRSWLFSVERSGRRGPKVTEDSNALGPIYLGTGGTSGYLARKNSR
jgi:hypothetical protein